MLFPFFQQHEKSRGTGDRLDLVPVICGILYVLHEGIRWRALPKVFGCWSSVYTRFSRWEKRGLMTLLFEITAAAKKSGTERCLDASHIKVHQDANTKDPDSEGIGLTRGGRNTKLHAVVDAVGHAVRLSLTAGQVNDCTQASAMSAELTRGEKVLADKAYDVDALRKDWEARGIAVCIPPKSNRKSPATYDKEVYKRRHHVENFFQRAKRCRRIGTRYEKTKVMFMAFVCIFASIDYVLH